MSVHRPRRENVNDIADWCRASIQEPSYFAQDTTKWKQMATIAYDKPTVYDDKYAGLRRLTQTRRSK